MIEKECIESCNAMLCNENAESYLCFVLTCDNVCRVECLASINEMATMIANAAIRNRDILSAMVMAFKSVEEIIRVGGGNE